MTWEEFWARLAIAAVLTPIVKLVAAIFDWHPAWWLAAVVALVLVFLGELLIPD